MLDLSLLVETASRKTTCLHRPPVGSFGFLSISLLPP